MIASKSPGVKQLGSCRPVGIWKYGGHTSIRCLRPSPAGTTCRVQSSVPAVQNLLAAIQSTERGLSTTAAQRSAILSATAALAELGRGSTTTSEALSATWKLLWTTEKETLFILKRAGWFGTQAGDVFQVIDTKNGSLQNVIEFPPAGAFIVQSDISVSSEQRMDFNFTNAALKLPNRKIQFPPKGTGWFDTIYLDDSIRISTDSRGDTLIVQRDGSPRVFE